MNHKTPSHPMRKNTFTFTISNHVSIYIYRHNKRIDPEYIPTDIKRMKKEEWFILKKIQLLHVCRYREESQYQTNV